MASQLIGLLLVALTVVLAQGASVSKNGKEMVYLGRSSHPVTDPKTGKTTIKASQYFYSTDTVAWTGVAENCVDFLGPGATALYIEEQPELNDIVALLAPVEGNSLYWIGGEWASSRFEWSNGVPFWSVPWDAGHPNSQAPVTKVMLYKAGPIDLVFRTAFLSELHYYICELDDGGGPITSPAPTTPPPTTPPPTTTTTTPPTTTPRICIVDNDLVIILDGSISVGAANFQLGLNFVRDIARAWFANENNRISFFTYGNVATNIFSLDNSLSNSQIEAAVLAAIYPTAPWTNTHLALAAALSEFTANGGTNPRNVILLTDGASTEPADTQVNAKALRDSGVEIFVVGIGADVDDAELLGITGGQTNHVFEADEFTDLVELLEPIQQVIC